MTRPAVPPTYHLRLRLHTGDNVTPNPFANRPYVITWHTATISGTTDGDSLLTADLDARSDNGMLDLGERDAQGQFTARITIPLRFQRPPPGPPQPLPPQRGVGDTDPPPQPPTPPSQPRRIDLGDGVYADNHDWDAYDRQVEAYQDEMLRRRWAHDPDEWQLTRPRGARPARGPSHGGAPSQTQREELSRVRAAYATRQRQIHDIAWRLYNLGYLVGPPPRRFDIHSQHEQQRLVDAIRRFSFAQFRGEEGDPEFIGPDGYLAPGGDMTGLWRAVIQMHDDRDP